MIQTARLNLRRWREEDRAPYAALNADPEVAYWLGGEIGREQSDRTIDRYRAHIDRHGFGRWAVERRADGLLIGSVGVMTVVDCDFSGFELGWRLARPSWGQGYATEAAAAALADTLNGQGLPEVIAFTSNRNLRSLAVMQRIGMIRDPARDFDHPLLPADHLLSRHVVYVARPRLITTA